jgi:hypothetical protein
MKKIFIISDLHLGGCPDERNDLGRITKPGFQICHAYPQLTAFIDWINKEAKDYSDFNGETEIVINGDIVDWRMTILMIPRLTRVFGRPMKPKPLLN